MIQLLEIIMQSEWIDHEWKLDQMKMRVFKKSNLKKSNRQDICLLNREEILPSLKTFHGLGDLQ